MVVKGEKLGRVLGFPTANVDVDSHYKLIPAEGDLCSNGGTRPQGLWRHVVYWPPPHRGGTQRSISQYFRLRWDIYGEDITIKLMAPIRKRRPF